MIKHSSIPIDVVRLSPVNQSYELSATTAPKRRNAIRRVNRPPSLCERQLQADKEQLTAGLLKRRESQLRELCEDILNSGCGELIESKARKLISRLPRHA